MGQDILDSCSESASLTANFVLAPSLTEEQEKDVSERYLLLSDFATLIMYKKIPQRSVHFGRLLPLTYGREASLCHCLLGRPKGSEQSEESQKHGQVVYKPHGVGWLSCLSLYIGNAKAGRLG